MSTVTTTARAKIVSATDATIYNLSMPNAGTEYSQPLSNSVKKITVRMRVKADCRIAFVSGDTATSYVTIKAGAVYSEENLDLNDVTIYLQSSSASQVAEILEWV